MSERQAELRNERMQLLAAMVQDLRAQLAALQERYDALMEGLGLDPSPECMDEYPAGRLKAEGYGLRMSMDSLGEALADAAAELVLKDAVLDEIHEVAERLYQWHAGGSKTDYGLHATHCLICDVVRAARTALEPAP
jgi:hypothetical protein